MDPFQVTGPALPQGLLDSRVESLNAITLSTHSTASPMDHVVVTGKYCRSTVVLIE